MPENKKTKKNGKKDKSKSLNRLPRALELIESLVLLEDVFRDEVGRRFKRLLRWLSGKRESDPVMGYRRYTKLWKAVAENQEFIRHPRVGNLLQDHWLERFLDDPNPFHRKAETASLHEIGSSLTEAYRGELEFFQKILRTDWESEFRKKWESAGIGEIPSMTVRQKKMPDKEISLAGQARKKIKESILGEGSKADQLLKEIAGCFLENGWGLFGRYRAFRWEDRFGTGGKLTGIEDVDPIRLENLVGYDDQRKPLIDNIEAFVSGKTANNTLLYGERGTGKSSTVKALLNSYQDRGLRLVEVSPSELREFHDILPYLRGRREKFILFVDDLSFEENETSYKGLKAVLEGAVEATPPNVILIATSNRRHLVREFFEDRSGGVQKDSEIHGADTVEEKLSLSDRFGLVVSFYSPDQSTYLRMVENWASVDGLRIPSGELHSRALLWARQNNGLSGRTARQFINDLSGKLK